MRTVAALCRELLPDRRTDGELVAAFTSDRAESTFLELVRRHGPLVWSVCRRLLPHPADAEDAFQATFLVLVSQSARLGAREALGPWLYRVAVLTARNVRRKNARRLARQRELPEDAPTVAPDSDLKADIDGALLALPERYREPIILCHLQGFTRREAAERLGCAEGTLSAWLNRGLAKLRIRLRDLDPVRVLSVPAVAVPAVLSANTVQAAVASGVAATVPPAISSLVEGVLHMLWIKKATAATFALCAVFAMGVGIGLGTRTGSTGVVAQDNAPAAKPAPAANAAAQDKAPAAKPAAPAKAAPPAGGNKLIDELAAQIQAAEKRILLHKDLLKLTSDKLDLLQKLNPKAKPPAEELEAQRRLQAELEASAAELQALIAQLAKLKTDKLKADKPAALAPPRPDTKETALVQLEELKAQLAKIEDERARLLAQADQAKRQLAATEERLRTLQRAAEALAAQAERDKKAPAAGNYLELTVGGKGNEFIIRELPAKPPGAKYSGNGPRALGPITTSDPAALAVLLARAKSDPNGPKEVRILTSGTAPKDLLQTATDACKAAGFKAISAEALDPPAPNRDKKVPPTASGQNLGNTIEELKRLEQLERKKIEDEIQELRKQRDAELQELKNRRESLNPKPLPPKP